MATLFTLFTSQRFLFYEIEVQAALVLIEQRRLQEISSKDDNPLTKWQTKTDCPARRCVQQTKIGFQSTQVKVRSGEEAEKGFC